jgi:hypothetical protein
MNALLVALALAVGAAVVYVAPADGGAAVIVCAILAVVAGLCVRRIEGDGEFLTRIFVAALLLRVVVALAIHLFHLEPFFGGDALTYDEVGVTLANSWQHGVTQVELEQALRPFLKRNWGMLYVVASLYTVIGRNPLAVQFFNAVIGAATAPVIFLCAQHIFRSLRVARLAALLVAFYPSLILWTAQGLKDGPIVFLLALVMLATLRLGERFTLRQFVVLVLAMCCLLSLRFYIFYMVASAAGVAFLIGMRPVTSTSLVRQTATILGAALVLTYLGVVSSASTQLDVYGDLDRVQISRNDLARAQSGFGQDVDVSTTSGALSAIPVGMVYLLFAPFPWQLANLRQAITLPEMIVWWASLPLLILGTYFTLKWRLRQALPILLFTVMLTLAYSIFQGNVGTAYRQRSQLLVFYFIFVSVGFVLVRERQEERRRHALELLARVRQARTPAGAADEFGARAAQGSAMAKVETRAGINAPRR